MEDQVSISQLLQVALKASHQVVGELADKAYGIRDQYRAGVGDLQRPGGGVQGVKQPVPGRDPAWVRALRRVDLPALV